MAFPIRSALVALLVAAQGLLGGCSSAEQPAEGPLVLAAASLQEAMEAQAEGWKARGHSRPVLSFAASSALARQIEAGAPGDLFLSADEDWMDEVDRHGLVAPGTREQFIGNSLVLIARAGDPVDLAIGPGFALAGALGKGRLAMADPDAVPAGRYGMQALRSLGVWDAVSGRIAVADNVRGALVLVSRGEAPLGIVYATDALADPGVRVVGRFPAASHAPIVYPLARLASSSHPDAEGFRQYLGSAEGRATFRRFGFAILGDAP